MKIFCAKRRHLLSGSAAWLALVAAARAQGVPARPIQLVVPFPAGGVTDLLARTLAQELARSLAAPVAVLNKPGASGIIACEAVRFAPPDGGTLMLGHIGTHAVNPHLFRKLPYDPVADFAPISLLASTPVMLLARERLPARSLDELIALAKSAPSGLTYASFGAGSSSHLFAEMFRRLANVELLHVPYKGPAPAMQDLIGGQVDLLFDTVASAMPQLAVGRVRALAVASRWRVQQAPEVPSFAELGLPSLDGGPWFGLYAPRAVPEPVRVRLEAEARRALLGQSVAAALGAQSILVIAGSGAELALHQRLEGERWGKLVRQLDIQIE